MWPRFGRWKCSSSQVSVQGQILLLNCLPGWCQQQPGQLRASSLLSSPHTLLQVLWIPSWALWRRMPIILHVAHSIQDGGGERNEGPSSCKFRFVLTASSLFLLSPTSHLYFLLRYLPSLLTSGQHQRQKQPLAQLPRFSSLQSVSYSVPFIVVLLLWLNSNWYSFLLNQCSSTGLIYSLISYDINIFAPQKNFRQG